MQSMAIRSIFSLSLNKFKSEKSMTSAKRIVKKSEALGKSFVRIRTSIGPKMQPWGTPQVSLKG